MSPDRPHVGHAARRLLSMSTMTGTRTHTVLASPIGPLTVVATTGRCAVSTSPGTSGSLTR